MTSVITGLIGHPVKHSLSPRIHRYWLKKHGLLGAYELWDTPPETLAEQIKILRAKPARGFNITVPHKQAVMGYVDEIDDIARRIGAINTVVNDGDKLKATNTDAYGFITNLKEALGDLSPYLERVVILGAGGAARAAVAALKDAGARQIIIMNRTAQTAKALAEEFQCETKDWNVDNKIPTSATLLVNTTSLGMQGKDPLYIDMTTLADHAVVHDIVYAPLETQLLREASEQGFTTVDGLGMLLYQAQKAFVLWHGIEPKVTGALRAHLLEEMV